MAVLLGTLLVAGCEKEPKLSVDDLPYWKWRQLTEIDPITDVESRSAILTSGPVSDGGYKPAELHFRCLSGKFDVYVSWSRYIGSKPRVDTRIDSDLHEPNVWGGSTDGTVSFYPFVSRAFLNRLAESKTYLVRVDSSNSPVTAKFETSNVKEQIRSVRAACNI